MKRRFGLSKSKIALFEQCPKRLWLSIHRPELAEMDDETGAILTQGIQIGQIACGLHPDGWMIEAADATRALEDTARLLASGWDRPIFEAAFAHDGVVVRIDLMLPHEQGWHVAEVKSSTSPKHYQLRDIATQLWVLRGEGITIGAASIRHIDRDFVLSRDGDYAGLFRDSFVDDLVEPIIAGRARIVAAARQTLEGEEPDHQMGAHCDTPFACSFKSHCGRDLPPPPTWPVSILRDRRIVEEWAERGVDDLLLVPAIAIKSPRLARIHAATISGEPFVDREAIAAETAGWAWPRMFLDFETIQFAAPRWVGTRPCQQVPFQFSAHIQQVGGGCTHHAFLSLDGEDPRRACAEALVALPATHGAIIAWNAGFEKACLLDLADAFADLAPELGYDGLAEVRSGLDAQDAYLEALQEGCTSLRRAKVERALLDYCFRDTEALMVMMDRLPGGA